MQNRFSTFTLLLAGAVQDDDKLIRIGGLNRIILDRYRRRKGLFLELSIALALTFIGSEQD